MESLSHCMWDIANSSLAESRFGWVANFAAYVLSVVAWLRGIKLELEYKPADREARISLGDILSKRGWTKCRANIRGNTQEQLSSLQEHSVDQQFVQDHVEIVEGASLQGPDFQSILTDAYRGNLDVYAMVSERMGEYALGTATRFDFSGTRSALLGSLMIPDDESKTTGLCRVLSNVIQSLPNAQEDRIRYINIEIIEKFQEKLLKLPHVTEEAQQDMLRLIQTIDRVFQQNKAFADEYISGLRNNLASLLQDAGIDVSSSIGGLPPAPSNDKGKSAPRQSSNEYLTAEELYADLPQDEENEPAGFEKEEDEPTNYGKLGQIVKEVSEKAILDFKETMRVSAEANRLYESLSSDEKERFKREHKDAIEKLNVNHNVGFPRSEVQRRRQVIVAGTQQKLPLAPPSIGHGNAGM